MHQNIFLYFAHNSLRHKIKNRVVLHPLAAPLTTTTPRPTRNTHTNTLTDAPGAQNLMQRAFCQNLRPLFVIHVSGSVTDVCGGAWAICDYSTLLSSPLLILSRLLPTQPPQPNKPSHHWLNARFNFSSRMYFYMK